MLDNTTRKRIDNCRDILVGKLPDPKSQIEQITIALIYKFMDDMDKESIELGGKAKFFSGDFEKYSWDNLFDPKVSAMEMLQLYSESIESMEKNPNIPQLFRDIFKNAYLPYRDPETLKLFLKTIGEFEYTHSEKLGDAFEYLLSVMGSQGDAGQFRTPRHIIDFLVETVNPGLNDTILDPACGTAGFLISAFKHIKEKNNNQLTPDQRKKLINNFTGYDISPDMVRLSLVNLYLHGFSDPHIYEYDTLTSEERWNDNFDVILANPPFMSPKGGIRPHKKFTVQVNKAEVLFTDYISEHLNPKGKAAIIIPNAVVANAQSSFKKLRKSLTENNLLAVISLPSGVFNPYSPIKTSVLLLDKELSKKSNEVLFITIENDGFDLGAQRRTIEKNDLPNAISLLNDFKDSLRNQNKFELEKHKVSSLLVSKTTILKEKNISLIANRYVTRKAINSQYETVKLGDVLDYEQPTKYIVKSVNYDDSYTTPVLTAGKTFILGYTNEKDGIFKNGLPVIIFDDFTTATKLVDFPFKVKSSAMKILRVKKDKADIEYLYHVMQNIDFDSSEHKRYWISQFSQLLIPLPSLPKQKEIVLEIRKMKDEISGFEKNIIATKNKIKDRVSKIWGE
ncbi:putative type I restriction enzymeP M protein [Polaribacter huanghezhanensis]|uniref:N-6 DNA methylase n=1 Tax=Polaribacter huanghezhanensis TaxID=1354726 RepID=UPI00264A0C77|nr:N-6 DNA methylase [Polaribacter huanghezhanensis]WKD85386.1 putative type I restriction enzymeP M protein [Polaribacter huanghezhanensis]